MKVTKLKSTKIPYIDTIFHIADIHVRNLKRHKEYKQVFKRLYEYIKIHKTPTSIIYVAGDIVHSKTELSPEVVSMVSEFFISLCDLCPTIVITGNHDCNLNNATRLDAISPIVDAIQHPNMYYLRDTGLYQLGNITFNVMSVFDAPAKFIPGNSFTAEYKIALHHGAVNNATTDLGAILSNTNVKNSLFDNHDLVLLGDIHKRQILQNYKPASDATNNITYPAIAYPGSLVQQNHAEIINHGMLVWDLPSRTSKYVRINNDYGYYTLDINAGVILNWDDDIPKKPRIRIRVTNTDPTTLKSLIADIKHKRKIEELTIQKNNLDTNKYLENKAILSNVRDTEIQNNLITDYITSKFPTATDEDMDGVRHINRLINSKLISSTSTRNVTWIPVRFEFSNMFSYGEDNVVDLSGMQGMYGLFAGNATGKSTLIDSLLFCCFDKCTRTTKATHVLNNKKNSFKCKFIFELNGLQYIITRTGLKNKDGHVRVLVSFDYIDEYGEQHSLNGEERDDTNRIIRSYIGTYEDFIMTSFSTQRNNSGFIDSKQSARKDLLSVFLDIDIFDTLYTIANEQIKSDATLYKEYTSYEYDAKLIDSRRLFNSITKKLQYLNTERAEVQQLVNNISSLIITTSAKLKRVDSGLDSPELIRDRIETELNTIDTNTGKIAKCNELLTAIQLHKATNLELLDPDIDSVYALDAEKKAIAVQRAQIAFNIEYQNKELVRHESIILALHNHEYDPNCKYCIQNEFVIAAEKSKSDIELVRTQLNDLTLQDIKLYDRDIEIGDTQSKIITYSTIKDILAKCDIEIQACNSKIQLLETQIISNNLRIESYKKALRESELQEENVKFNVDINKQLSELQDELYVAQSEIDELNNNINDTTSLAASHNASIQVCTDGISKLHSLESNIRLYEYYLDAISRDGVPYQLIERALPQLETEINNILGQVVDFNIVLNTDGKNINAYIVYDTDNYWPIELISGMERFITSIAIRVALVTLSSLPRTNFLIIDEGLGNLDSSMLNSIGLMFDYLKSQFQFIWLISHIDVSRDVVDHIIELSKEGEFSKISHE